MENFIGGWHEPYRLEKYALSDEEIKKYYEKNIINPKIKNAIVKESDDGYVSYIKSTYNQVKKAESYDREKIYLKFWYLYLASLGIKIFFTEDDNTPESPGTSSIFITDFHLIFSYSLKRISEFLVEPEIYDKPKDLLIIPLHKIKNWKLESTTKGNVRHEGHSYTKGSSPVKGAIIGGIIAGPTGAIVGAVANQKEKKVNIPAYTTPLELYSLVIEMDDGTTIKFYPSVCKGTTKSIILDGNQKLCEININEPQYSDDSIKMINERLNFLLCRAKNKYSDEEMSNIVNQTIEHGIEFNKKVEQDEKKSLIFGCIFFAVIFIILIIFQL